MKQVGIREYQIASVKYLKEITDFFDDNNIRYAITYGTLLGAVRDKTYIPWDDDVDIFIDIKDYDKLKNALNQLPEYYYYQDWKDDDSIILGIGIIFCKKLKKAPSGIQLDYNFDITFTDFAKDLESAEWFEKKGLKIRRNCDKKYQYKKTFLRRIKHILVNFINLFRKNKLKNNDIKDNIFVAFKKSFLSCIYPSFSRRNKKLIKLYEKVKVDNGTFMYTVFPSVEYKEYRYDDLIKIEFEGELFSAPKCYDGFLRKTYGDYNTPVVYYDDYRNYPFWIDE